MTIQETLNQRNAVHGDFAESSILQNDLITSCRRTAGWNKLNVAQQRALHMIIEKIVRALYGNSDEVDHWHDIAGYATLAENSIHQFGGRTQKADSLPNRCREEGA